MINRQLCLNLRDLNTSHQAIAIRIKNFIVRMRRFVIFLFIKRIYNTVHGMFRIIFFCFFPELFIVVIRKICNRLIVSTDQLCISVLIPHITDRRIKKNSRSHQKSRCDKDIKDNTALFLLFLFSHTSLFPASFFVLNKIDSCYEHSCDHNTDHNTKYQHRKCRIGNSSRLLL